MSDPRDASGYSANDLISMGFVSTPKLAAQVQNTKKASEVEVKKFDAIVVGGGDELKKAGSNYIQAGLWRGSALRDGNLIPGQQNFSGSEAAEAVIQALGE